MPHSPASPVILVKLALMALFWASAFVIGRRLMETLDPFTAAAARFAFSSAFLAAVVLALRGGLPRLSKKQILGVCVLGLSGVFAYNALFFQGLKTITAAKAALILAVNPVVIALAAALLFREKISARQALGIAASLAGVVVVVADGSPLRLLKTGVGPGEAAMFGAMAAWAFYSLLGKRLLAGIAPLAAVWLANGFGAAALVLAAFAVETPAVLVQVPAATWAGLLFLGVVSSGIANTWYYQGIARVGAARAANFINLVPVFAALLGWIFLGETLTLPQLLGGVLVLAGVTLVNRRKKRPEKIPDGKIPESNRPAL